MKRNRRIQKRDYVKIPILYTREYKNIYHEALTYDISAGGLSFNAAHPFSSGDCFLIRPIAEMPGDARRLSKGAWPAQVQWCTRDRGNNGYRVGIRRHCATDLPKDKPSVAVRLGCELCDAHEITDAVSIGCGIRLCSGCFSECYHSAGGRLQETMSRFLAGNVI